MLTVFYFEFDNAMLHLSTGDKMLAALFQSVTFRTAGFNTIDFADCRLVTLFIAMVLMFIGASPSSTGGGIKTTTFAVLVLSIKSLFQARDKVEIYHRTIPAQTVLRSIAILLFSLSFLVVFCAMLLATQTGRFIDIIFEATSAMGTVGLSTGMTGELNTVGKLLVTLLMYAGRIGPLTVALAVSEVRKVNVAYPETKIGVG
jgi:trk system potassium uptake protein TrkH